MSKKYRQIVLHAGLHKTGSTSIQASCQDHRELLQAHGFHFPVFELGSRRFSNHSDPITAALLHDHSYGWSWRLRDHEDETSARAGFCAQLSDILDNPPCERLLLSGENVCIFHDGDQQILRQHLLQYTDDLRVVAYIRSPMEAIHSMMQQHSWGRRSNPLEKVLGQVQERCENLQRNYPQELEVYNFHSARQSLGGLVGHFFGTLGVPASAIESVSFRHANSSMSQEGYDIAHAINSRYPAGEVEQHGVQRGFQDLRSVFLLPGQPFRIKELEQSEHFQQLIDETKWLEEHLGFDFPEPAKLDPTRLWQMDTLKSLEAALNNVANKSMRDVGAEYLLDQANSVLSQQPGPAAILKFIGENILSGSDQPNDLLLQQLGPDYFKYAALQSEHTSPGLALVFMRIALSLRPGAKFLEEKITHYKKRLEEG